MVDGCPDVYRWSLRKIACDVQWAPKCSGPMQRRPCDKFGKDSLTANLDPIRAGSCPTVRRLQPGVIVLVDIHCVNDLVLGRRS
eukprot:3503195-Prorocentrum_lima.AAC.1